MRAILIAAFLLLLTSCATPNEGRWVSATSFNFNSRLTLSENCVYQLKAEIQKNERVRKTRLVISDYSGNEWKSEWVEETLNANERISR